MLKASLAPRTTLKQSTSKQFTCVSCRSCVCTGMYTFIHITQDPVYIQVCTLLGFFLLRYTQRYPSKSFSLRLILKGIIWLLRPGPCHHSIAPSGRQVDHRNHSIPTEKEHYFFFHAILARAKILNTSHIFIALMFA